MFIYFWPMKEMVQLNYFEAYHIVKSGLMKIDKMNNDNNNNNNKVF